MWNVCIQIQIISFFWSFIWQEQKWLGRTEGLHKSLLILCIILHYFDNKLICQFVRFPVLGEKKASRGNSSNAFYLLQLISSLQKKNQIWERKKPWEKRAIWHSNKKNVSIILDLFRLFFHLCDEMYETL